MYNVVLALFLVLNFPGAVGDVVSAKTVDQTQRSVVTVRSKESWCTGFVIGITRAVTAQHCVAGSNGVLVDGLPARVLRESSNLALLDTQVLDKPVLKLAKSSPKQGDSVASFGHAFGGPSLVYQRQVAGYLLTGYMLLDGVISPGMSGGPVVNTAGEVVGINEATNQHVAAITPLADLKKFLD